MIYNKYTNKSWFDVRGENIYLSRYFEVRYFDLQIKVQMKVFFIKLTKDFYFKDAKMSVRFSTIS